MAFISKIYLFLNDIHGLKIFLLQLNCKNGVILTFRKIQKNNFTKKKNNFMTFIRIKCDLVLNRLYMSQNMQNI